MDQIVSGITAFFMFCCLPVVSLAFSLLILAGLSDYLKGRG